MHQLKDIARRMDNCHVRTAKRWWKKLDSECAYAGLPRVKPDVQGHGPHRWEDATADRLIAMWKAYYTAKGTTAAITRAKYAGDLTDARQMFFTVITEPNDFKIPQYTDADAFPPKKSNAKKSPSKVRVQPGAMGKTITRRKKSGDSKTQQADATQARRRRPAAAR